MGPAAAALCVDFHRCGDGGGGGGGGGVGGRGAEFWISASDAEEVVKLAIVNVRRCMIKAKPTILGRARGSSSQR